MVMMKTFQYPFIKIERKRLERGVAIHAKEHYEIKLRPDLNINDLKTIWLEAIIKNARVLLCSLYHEPRSPVKMWESI